MKIINTVLFSFLFRFHVKIKKTEIKILVHFRTFLIIIENYVLL